MSARGLIPEKLHIPFGVGLNQKSDPRALEVPALTICKDVQFTETGGLQTRYPYAVTSADIFGGGTLSTARRLVENGNELLCFTKDTLYSWNVQLSKWVSKGTHLAVKVAEDTAFATTGDQVDADRAELNGTIVYVWTDAASSYAAAIDKTTGAVLMGPTVLPNIASPSSLRPRLVALSTKILLTFSNSSSEIKGIALDPADPAASILAGAATLYSASATAYDVTRVLGTDTAVLASRATGAASYEIMTITAALVVATSTKARACAGAIAVSSTPDGTGVQVIRAATNTTIVGDFITIATLADVTINQAVGTTTANAAQAIAVAHRSVADSGAFRCYAFWSSDETTSGGGNGWMSESNWVDTAGAIGTQVTFVRRLGIRSRAFDHDGRVYVWGAFFGASQFVGLSTLFGLSVTLQNTYFLYRDDAFLVAKAAAGRCGAMGGGTATDGSRWLPGVALTGTNTYSFAGLERRAIPMSVNQSGYGSRAPRDIAVTFDTNEARRCARLGQTLYITGGEILQYDGSRLVELGYHVYPWYFGAIEQASGAMVDGTYAYKATYRWDNAKGEIDRSTTATHGTVTIAAGPNGVSIPASVPLYVTHKTANAPAVEWWRTAIAPSEDAPFYLVTSKDPSDTSNPNAYIANDPSAMSLAAFTDEMDDSTATGLETNPENGAVLENLAPPAATLIQATADRLFLAGIAGDPHRVWYSKLRGDGEVAAFHDALTVNVPHQGGDITAIIIRDGILYVFRQTCIYAFSGEGFDNTSGGRNFELARSWSDVGAISQEAVANTDGGLIFKSSKGWFVLDGATPQYIGAPICDYDSDSVVAVHVIESQHQVRCLTTSRLLVLDTNVNQWGEWTISDGLHAAIWNGTYHYLTATGPKAEQTTYTALTYGWDVETAWIPLNQMQGWGRVWMILLLGQYQSAFHLRVRLGKNYATTYFQDKYWTPSPTTAGGPLQMKHAPSQQEVSALKIRLTAVSATDHDSHPTGEAAKLTGLALEIGLERGLTRHLPAAQKQ